MAMPGESASNNNGGSASRYDRSMNSYLKNRIPGYNVLDTDEAKNTKYKYFQHVGMKRPEAIAKNSVTLNNDFNNTAFSSIDQDKSFGDLMYARAAEDKPGRLKDYRLMAAFSEVADALDEICDETINPDENDQVCQLKFRNDELTSDKKKEIYDEFDRYVEHYDLHNNGWQYFRQFLTEGELYFEQIIHTDYVNQGVLGIINIPADQIDPIYSNIQNMLVKGYLYQKPIFDKQDPKKIEKYEPIPFEENQVVYIHNGSYNETKEFIVPFIENCRRAYRQLSMIEDAVVIHRMVHAPLRFVFNVDVGRLPVPQAEAYLRKLQAQYWSTKTFDADQGDIVKKYSPQSTLDSYWFAKRQGQEPTTVTEIGGQQDTGGMEILDYFIKKLYRSLKTPTSRLTEEASFSGGADILREELKFAKMIMRQQQKFASGIKRGFVTHLKLRKMWSEKDGYDLAEQDLNVVFNAPSNFYEMRNNQNMELKLNSYNNMTSDGSISKIYAQKKVLNFRDEDVLANLAFLKKDAEIQFEIAQITALGPSWRKQLLDQANQGVPAEGGDMGGSMPAGGGGSSLPPNFGGVPADTSGGVPVDSNVGVPPPPASTPEPEV